VEKGERSAGKKEGEMHYLNTTTHGNGKKKNDRRKRVFKGKDYKLLCPMENMKKKGKST